MVRFIFRAMIQVNSFDLKVELSLVNLRIIILLGEISRRMDHLRSLKLNDVRIRTSVWRLDYGGIRSRARRDSPTRLVIILGGRV